MIDPQENITIGNFLYALGLGVGVSKGASAPPAAVNLLQQTSYDKCLGDVMLHFPGATRLFEFKRRSNTDRDKELEKLHLLQIALGGLPRVQAICRRVHLFVETGAGKNAFAFHVRPYLDLQLQDAGETTFTDFINGLVAEATAAADASGNRDANMYIRDYVCTWGATEGKSSTGLLVTVGSSGGVEYAVLDDLADLDVTGARALKHQVDRHAEQERQIAAYIAYLARQQGQQQSHQATQTRGAAEHERKIDLGNGRRM